MGKLLCSIALAVLFLQVIHQPHRALCEEDVDDDEDESGSGEDDNLESPPDKTFTDIIKLTVDTLISSHDGKKDKEVLLKYYFTDKKNVSIWPKIVEETERTTNEEFVERELSDMENTVKNIYRRFLECDLKIAGIKDKKKRQSTLVRCYLTLNEFINVGFVDFNYQRSNVQAQSQMLEMNIAYSLMVLLIHHMISSLPGIDNPRNFLAQIEFYRVAETLIVSLRAVRASSIQVRVDSITPTTICHVQEILWQEFTGHCESHMRTRRELDSIDGIGGTSNLFQQKLRASVTDKITGEEICFAEHATGTNETVYNMKLGLTRICNRRRAKYVEQIRKEITKYYNDRTEAVLFNLPKLWGSQKTKLKTIQNELQNRLKASKKGKKKEKSD